MHVEMGKVAEIHLSSHVAVDSHPSMTNSIGDSPGKSHRSGNPLVFGALSGESWFYTNDANQKGGQRDHPATVSQTWLKLPAPWL